MKQSVLSAHKRTNRVAVPTKVLRADIQGLRALAVVVVVLDHLLAWPSGGFVGVDIFFVISGFLITGHLIREWELKGTISFVDFYKKRAKRILPAAAVVLAATVVTSFLLFTTPRAWPIFWDGVWSSLFAANWRFAAVETDYFQAGGAISPLQHFWSLAVEEQFYFVWPWLMLGSLALMSKAKKFRDQPRLIAGIVILTLTAASFIWALLETHSAPTQAYFSTLSRAWELGPGALLALGAPLCEKLGPSVRPFLAWAGLIGMVVSVFIVNPDSLFPAPLAALPVISTAFVIAAGTGGPQRFLLPLTNSVSGYIGDVSYSLYLWHFPVIVFLSAIFTEGGLSYYLIAVLTMIFLAVFSYHLVEDPIRSSNWLIRSKAKSSPKWKYSDRWLAFLIAFTVLSLLWTFTPQTSPVAIQASQGTGWQLKGAEDANKSNFSPELAKLQESIKTAIAAEAWPSLKPDENDLSVENWLREMGNESCIDVRDNNLFECYFPTPGADKTAVLLGDSHAIAWSPGLRDALSDAGYNLQMLTMQQCAAADAKSTLGDGAPYPECSEHRRWALETIAEIKPDVVFLSSARSAVERLASGAEGQKALNEYANGMTKTIQEIKPHVTNVVTLASPPTGVALDECRTALSTPSDCHVAVSSTWKSFVKAEKRATNENDAMYVDTRHWFCSDKSTCPAFANETVMRVDTDHLTIEYSRVLAPVIQSEILSKL